MAKDPLMPDDGDELEVEDGMELTSPSDFAHAAEVMVGIPSGSLEVPEDDDVAESPKPHSDPRAGILRGPFFLSESGHLHRTERPDRTRVDIGLLFQNVPTDKLYELVDDIDGKLIPIAANHYYRVAHDGCIRIHRHWGEDRTYLSTNAVAFIANAEETKKVLKRLYKSHKDVLVEAKGDDDFKLGNKKVGELDAPEQKQIEAPVEEDIPTDNAPATSDVVEGEIVGTFVDETHHVVGSQSTDLLDQPVIKELVKDANEFAEKEQQKAAEEMSVTPAAAKQGKKKKKHKFDKKHF
jgi:hypothetical protein